MTEEYKLRLGDTVEIEGESWVWEGVRRGTEARLRREDTADDWLSLSVPELLSYAGTARRQSDAPLRPSGGTWPTDVLDLEKHLLEVFAGIPMDDTAQSPRPGYDPDSTTQEARIARKVAELAGTSLSRSRETFFNYWKAYRAGGIAELNTTLHPTAKKRLQIAKADPRLIAVIDKELDRRVNMPTTSRRHCALIVRRALEAMYPGDKICDTKDRTLQGLINERDKGRYSFEKATSRRTAANSPDREYHSVAAHRLGAVCEIDSTPLDVQVWDKKGNVFRPTATVLFCVASRVPIAWALHANSPSGFDHGLLLARAIVGRRKIPGSAAAELSGSATLPAELMKRVNPYLDDESLAVPWIFPHSITIDGGPDFRSDTFETACRVFGIHIVLAPANAPTGKPHVERNFGTMSTDFATWLAGSVGNAVHNRGKKDKPTLTLESVRLAFDAWLTTVYLNRKHGGLQSTLFPGREWTPNQMYAALFEVGPGVQLPFRADEFLSLLPSKPRVISDEGIQINNRFYDSDELEDLRGRSQTGAAPGSRHARKFEVHFDPFNTGAVWVKHPETDEWIECWDKSIDERGGWMVAETETRLLERFGDAKTIGAKERAAFLDEIEKRERGDSAARKRHLREAALKRSGSPDLPALPAAPVPLELRQWSEPTDVEDIDWDSPDYDIVTVKEIRP